MRTRASSRMIRSRTYSSSSSSSSIYLWLVHPLAFQLAVAEFADRFELIKRLAHRKQLSCIWIPSAGSTVAIKRFYKHVGVKSVQEKPGVYGVTLDGRWLKTPRKQCLEVPGLELASAIASEWAVQHVYIRRSSMPLTALANAALDTIPHIRPTMEASLMQFLETDTAAFRVAYPERLKEEQDRVLGPLAEYVQTRYGCKLYPTRSLVPIPPDPDSVRGVRQEIQQMDHLTFAALDLATSTTKSLVIALCLRDGFIDSFMATSASRCEEDFQMHMYGRVEGSHDLDIADTKVRLASSSFVFAAVPRSLSLSL
ncbi:ATP synthase mitochondrial F1 complex assembly factor 2 [Porphyridium purpureum]|uniref:ATP synthase mitochondrial F1 complex assembly factor 2 n=1 Tax=Porphyridium purpureum TaxID=35688 RepID=A0A5J4YMJ5_PORPP|nr:ATP synthase mitochondrial F1 complex assembly factor 2 [Porphyridium purpureum]|eukprot:POR0497..scf295_9